MEEYRVIWEIDLDRGEMGDVPWTILQVAKRAMDIQRDVTYYATVFTVKDKETGQSYEVDTDLGSVKPVFGIAWALKNVTFDNAPTFINHEGQTVREWAKALLAGDEFNYLKKVVMDQ